MSETTEQALSAEPTRPDRPRIYVASLSDYNAGILHGTWLDADQTASDIHTGITEMLAASPTTARHGDPAEEWAIHDHEGFGPVRLSEYERIERVAALARCIRTHGNAYAYWWGIEDPAASTDDTELTEAFEEHYLGEYESVEDYGHELLRDLGINPDELPGVPEGLRPYITLDVEAWVRDMQYAGELRTAPSERGIYVFANL